ncbi:hypothetical protein GOEFS_109_00080 [Gordonia effusa NBRC 100432]|uniref:Uncharacterized protein n=1 Tax=Gordonia effusa NBRC 100432 TaxID=1077974 RepID=H0R5B2_9ACTN|nr:hypothetical protein [Gordonia effusa]GAB20263.1 hypothetical protein GOEFS_109_00080 [Gordonia effusa NBRC 100432]
MSSTRTAFTGFGVIDPEAGTVDEAGVKAAGVVAEKFYDGMEQARIDAELADRILDGTTALTRAARDRDRAFPRDLSSVEGDRKRRRLPAAGALRAGLSSRQRKARSAAKRRVVGSAPRSQVREMQRTISDPGRWTDVNSALRASTGNAQHLSAPDRASVQRMDRLIQAYEADNGRGHVVYAVIELPTDTAVASRDDVPATLQRGARISFDQYTMCSHTLHEAAAAVERRRDQGAESATVIVEIETTRGMYLGRSDSLDDTSHVLPRGMALQVTGIDPHADYRTRRGLDSTLVVQLTDSPRSPDYQPPVTGRRVFREQRAERAARAAAQERGTVR